MIKDINEQLSDEQKQEKGCIQVDLCFTKKSFDIIANELKNSDQGIPAEGWVKEEFCQVNDYFISYLDDHFYPQLG